MFKITAHLLLGKKGDGDPRQNEGHAGAKLLLWQHPFTARYFSMQTKLPTSVQNQIQRLLPPSLQEWQPKRHNWHRHWPSHGTYDVAGIQSADMAYSRALALRSSFHIDNICTRLSIFLKSKYVHSRLFPAAADSPLISQLDFITRVPLQWSLRTVISIPWQSGQFWINYEPTTPPFLNYYHSSSSSSSSSSSLFITITQGIYNCIPETTMFRGRIMLQLYRGYNLLLLLLLLLLTAIGLSAGGSSPTLVQTKQ
jgi:hypothetical protein